MYLQGVRDNETAARQMGQQHGRAGRRPVVVLSPPSYNEKTILAVVCPVASQVKGYPFEVILPPGSRISGAILADDLDLSMAANGKRSRPEKSL